MVVGDTGALARMEKEAKRVSKAQKKMDRLIRKKERGCGLGRKKSKRANEACEVVRRNMTHFSNACLLPTDNVRRFRRRLLRAKNVKGRALFYVSEIGGSLEEGGWGVVVAPRAEEATVNLALQVATKDHSMQDASLISGLPLLKCSSHMNAALFEGCVKNNTPSPLSDVHALVTLPDGFTPLFLLAGGVEVTLSPRDASLDECHYASLQAQTIRLLRLKETDRTTFCAA